MAAAGGLGAGLGYPRDCINARSVPHCSGMSETAEHLSLSPTLRSRAEALIHQFFSQCFWFWRPDVTVETPETAKMVIRQLREHGGKEGWKCAAELQTMLNEQCL